ncbi:MAG: hypothetical protein LH472_05735 [Pyrinomonadaceae bacterium]|nr:hypothetical protein [Pyrinomonadaceae bacterium]
MKKYIATLLMIIVPAVMIPLAMPVTADAQTYVKRVVGRNGRVRYVRVKKPGFYRRHRNASNIAIGTGGGALLGGILGGGKGALIGAGVGAGSSALYTYKLNKKKKRYYKVRRR